MKSLLLALTLAVPSADRAPVERRRGSNRVGTSVGLDGALVSWSVRYARGFSLGERAPLWWHTTFTLPMTQPDFGDWRLASGLQTEALRVGRFAWPVSLAMVTRTMATSAVRAWGLGTELRTTPGWYPSRWFVAADLSWDQQWGTHLRHRDAYRQFVYEGVQDGWYRTSGFGMRYGLLVGGRPWRPLRLWLRGGYEQHGRFNRLIPPAYLIVGADIQF